MQVDNKHRDDPSYQAANWLVLLSETPVPEAVQADFDAWLAANPDHERAWSVAQETYGLIGKAPRRHPAAGQTRLRSANRRVRVTSRRRRVAAGGLGIGLAASITLFFAPALWMRLSADRMTGVGEVTTMTLADGSRVELGPDTAVKVRYSGKERHVDLLQGEASFEVRHDVTKPFTVQAGDVDTRVLGTAFEVRRERTGTYVAVAHGKVRVGRTNAGPDGIADLLGGDWIRLDKAGQVEKGVGPGSQNAPDRQMVIVKDRPVSEVIDRLRPWYNGAILVSGHPTQKLRVTGAYDPHEAAKALALLLSAHGGEVRSFSPWIIWVSLPAN